jgi:hypothetical protein
MVSIFPCLKGKNSREIELLMDDEYPARSRTQPFGFPIELVATKFWYNIGMGAFGCFNTEQNEKFSFKQGRSLLELKVENWTPWKLLFYSSFDCPWWDLQAPIFRIEYLFVFMEKSYLKIYMAPSPPMQKYEKLTFLSIISTGKWIHGKSWRAWR